jgi:hypothetical protein
MARWLLLGCFLGALVFLAGCSGSDRPLPVSGEVLLDGKALGTGTIALLGEGGATPESFEIKDGKFEGRARPGKKRVEIRAYAEGTPTTMSDMVVEGSGKVNFIPERYNKNSTLTAEVTASGLNPSKFELQLK